MARRFAKVSQEVIVAINEAAFFYPSDLVNTKTTIPLRVGEERWISTSSLRASVYIHHYSPPLRRARNNGRSTDNVRTDCGFDRSNFRLAGHVDRSKFNRIKNEINLRFLLFSCLSCYSSSRCVLRNFDMKSW